MSEHEYELYSAKEPVPDAEEVMASEKEREFWIECPGSSAHLSFIGGFMSEHEYELYSAKEPVPDVGEVIGVDHATGNDETMISLKYSEYQAVVAERDKLAQLQKEMNLDLIKATENWKRVNQLKNDAIAERDQYREALESIASQSISQAEMDAKDSDFEYEDADFEGAYEAIVQDARNALNQKESSDE